MAGGIHSFYGQSANVTANTIVTKVLQATINSTGIVSAGTVTGTNLSGTHSGTSSGTNTGDNAANTNYASDYRAANFIAGTNYAPATSGAAILYGNGAGGFSNVTVGTGLTFTSGTLAATSGGMVYPGAGIPNSTGTAWGTSYTTSGTGTVIPLTAGPTFTGTLTASTVNVTSALTTPSIVTSQSNGSVLLQPTTTTDSAYVQMSTTGGGYFFGSENSSGSNFQSTPYDMVVSGPTGRGITFKANTDLLARFSKDKGAVFNTQVSAPNVGAPGMHFAHGSVDDLDIEGMILSQRQPSPTLPAPTNVVGTLLTSDGAGWKASAPAIVQNSQNAGYTLVLSDAGKHIYFATAGAFTIPANASVAFPIGTAITFVNISTSSTIAITTDTMYLAGAGTTGTRTLAQYGTATALKITATSWIISGVGLT
jgi:hypothetical protein